MRVMLYMHFLAIYACMTVNGDAKGAEKSLSRKKRYLLFPGSLDIIQLIIGVGIPVEIHPEVIILGWAFRAVYNLPRNLTELMPMDYGASSRKKRHLSRWDFYKMLADHSSGLSLAAELLGIHSAAWEIRRGDAGRSCVLRSICEASDVPMDKYHGLFEELIHTLFTPTSTNEDIEHHTDNEYYAAQKLGRTYRGKCKQLFSECTTSWLDMITHSPFENTIM